LNVFFTAFTRIGMVDMCVAMLEQDYLSKDVVGTNFDTFPAGRAFARVDPDKFRLHWK